MPRLALCLGLILLAAPIASASAQGIGTGAETSGAIGKSAGPVFKSSVELVALSVTVTDSKQKYVPGLHQAQFEVYEDGVLQDLSFFAADPVPLDLAILLDTSASMLDKMPVVREAAVGFARTLRGGDRGAVIEFKDTVRVLQPLTGDVGLLESAIGRTAAKGGTALHTALYVALKELARENLKTGDVRRQAIVVLSDGLDTRSLVTGDDVLELARRGGIAIYTISLPSSAIVRQSYAGSQFFSESDYSMRTLAQETGGRAFFPLGIQDLAPVYSVIALELANQYALGYVSKNPARSGGLRRIAVRLPSRPDARPRTRLGYLAARLLQPGIR
ncbi:MAG: VWA domain-containing protein [Acidobacteria bacterium]|nr:VWA domain-containing protein [Acidobacteriota bacterium]